MAAQLVSDLRRPLQVDAYLVDALRHRYIHCTHCLLPYCAIGVLLFSIYLIVDTQLIVNKNGLSKEDYILGALILYMDIVTIFIYILQLLGGNRN